MLDQGGWWRDQRRFDGLRACQPPSRTRQCTLPAPVSPSLFQPKKPDKYFPVARRRKPEGEFLCRVWRSSGPSGGWRWLTPYQRKRSQSYSRCSDVGFVCTQSFPVSGCGHLSAPDPRPNHIQITAFKRPSVSGQVPLSGGAGVRPKILSQEKIRSNDADGA